MANYETVIITRQDVAPTQVETLIDEMVKILTDAGATIARREYWGLRTLAYRIRKNRKGHYTLLNYTSGVAERQEMERLMGLNPDVLRFLTLVTEDLPTEQSAILKEKAYAEARPVTERPAGGYDRPRSEQSQPRTTPVIKVVKSNMEGESK